jgi:hypothetical protein
MVPLENTQIKIWIIVHFFVPLSRNSEKRVAREGALSCA